ncbi:MAG: cytochrome bc complex cytochrome b subunit [Verrucomicrobia bacterium]|nr:MAG: cytochrome bc complex cytochrome b subunit [Verrucomicrobiota bacterium]
MPDLKKIGQAVYGWVNERLDLDPVIEHARAKTVPVHKHTFWYYWGGISLCLFLVQVVTGILLMIYYRPGPDAYASVREITYEIHFGWLIRSLHAWSANLMVAAVLVHMFSVFFMKAYQKPREFGWWTGLGLLALCMVFGFSGYLLPMDELSFFATKVGLSIPGIIPGVEPIISKIVRAGPEVNEFTLQRFFTLHVVVLPLLFIPLLAFHLFLIQKHGNALPPAERLKPAAGRKTIPFFPNFMLKDLAVWLIAINVLALLAAFYPWQLGPQADPIKPAPIGIHPEWYFMSQFELLKVVGRFLPGVSGEVAGIGLFTIGMVLWALVPLFDLETTGGRRGRAITYFGLFMLAGLVALTIFGYFDLK